MKTTEMGRTLRRAARIVGLLTIAGFASAGVAEAGLSAAARCNSALAKASGGYAQTVSKELAKCGKNVIKGIAESGSCPDAKAAGKIEGAAQKLRDAATKSCGVLSGVDLGMPATCPGVSGECDDIVLSDATDAADCAICTVDAVVAGLSDELLHAALVHSDDKILDSCQTTISKAGSKLVQDWNKEYTKCADSRIKGKTQDTECHPAEALADSVASLSAAICKACGGVDEVCGGFFEELPTDLTAAAIGLPAVCPAVTTPDGSDCDVPLTNLQAIADCVACTAEFAAECSAQNGASALGVSVNCNPAPAAPCVGPYTYNVTTSFSGDPAGLTTRINYPGAKLQLSSAPTNDSGIGDGLFTYSNLDVAPVGGAEDQLSIALISINTPIPVGPFAQASFQCRPDSAGAPIADDFSCTAEASDIVGDPIVISCSVELVPAT